MVCNHGVVGSNPIRSTPMSRFLLTAVLLAAACARKADPAASRPPAATPPPAAAPSSTPRLPVALGLAQRFVGTWDVFPAGIGGPHLSITIDSATGPVLHGRLVRALAGDVLLDTGRFRPLSGTVADDSTFRVTIGWSEPGPPPVELAGRLTGAEWRLTRFVWGGEQQVVPGRTWTGRKEP